jgi:hypothetical protein
VLDRLAALLVEKETIEHDEFEALFDGVLPPRSGGPTPKRMTVHPGPEAEPEVEPDSDEGGGKRRRPGPAPQPA